MKKKAKLPWNLPLSVKTVVYKEMEVIKCKDVLIKGEAFLRIIDASGEKLAECQSWFVAEKILKALSK